MFLGLAFIAAAIAIPAQQRATQRGEVREIAALRAELDSVHAALVRARTPPDSALLAESIAGRTYLLGRREYHVQARQPTIDDWWTFRGPGTLLSAFGALCVGLAAFVGWRGRAV
ncbi:MAG: hypothetical protein WD771_06200 [Gemmatimonadaceae bacterium]